MISSCTYRKRHGVEHQGKRALQGKRAVKILHTADVHLDCDSYGKAEQRQAHRALYYHCFQTIIERAIAAEVDVLLIAAIIIACQTKRLPLPRSNCAVCNGLWSSCRAITIACTRTPSMTATTSTQRATTCTRL